MSDYIWNLSDLATVSKNGYKVFSCFSCGGGSSMGYKLAGYEVLGNCEIDPKINQMYLTNHHPKYNYLMGVQDMKNKTPFPDELYNLDILDGSPPCSTFSLAGEREKNWGKAKKFREGQAKQVLDDLFFEFLDLAEILQPKVIVAENVKGMIVGNAKGYVTMIVKRLKEIGYDTQLFLLNAATMGVPQRRERVFFIARRHDLGMPEIKLKFNMDPIPYGDFADINYKALTKGTMTYERWTKRKFGDKKQSDVTKRREGGKNSGFNMQYIYKNEVPPTSTASSTPIRFDVPGYISDRDISIIQTFPQDYNYCGQPVQYVCGMSVPPKMMQRIAEQVKFQLLDKIEG